MPFPLKLSAPSAPIGAAIVLAPVLILIASHITSQMPSRRKAVAPASERVLVLGASSGVGAAAVKAYAARGARVCAVARREERLAKLVAECTGAESDAGARIFYQVADFAVADDMVRLRERLLKEWGGLDTVLVCAGVSALQPVMMLAGVPEDAPKQDATAEGISDAMSIASRAIQGNFMGPFVAAVALIPMLERTSSSPAVLLVSSVAAIIPAPTRALYASTKASSLLLYQALAIEHPRIAFTFVLPATIEGDFRAGAVDSHLGGVRENDPNKTGLKIGKVVHGCISAIDRQKTGTIIMPQLPYRLGHFIYYLFPSFIEKQARKKYNFHPAE